MSVGRSLCLRRQWAIVASLLLAFLVSSLHYGLFPSFNPYVIRMTTRVCPTDTMHELTEDTHTKKNTQILNTSDDSSNAGPEVKVILLTYMRSGSTFTGDLFNQHPQVFYFYEPLWSLDFHFKKKQPAYFFDRRPMMYEEKNKQQMALLKRDIMNNSISCRFQSMYIQPLLLHMTTSKSRSCQSFGECTAKNPGLLGLFNCLSVLRKACTSAKVSIAKTVRLSMEEAETLLKADSKFKVIHLVRDPRGVLKSRQISGISWTYRMTTEQFCSTVLQDVSRRLQRLYPGQVLRARYEDLAQKPLEFSARLLDFAGLDMDRKLRQYVWNITSSGNVDKEPMWRTQRNNSSHTASQWRQNSDFRFVAEVDKTCAQLFELMGYLPFANETDLRNLQLPYFRDLKQVPGLWTL